MMNEFNENVAVEQISNFQPIEIDEAKSFMNNLISKNKKQLRKGGFSVTIDENSLSFKEVKKTNLTVPTFSASVKPNISSKVFMVKKQDSIYTCLYNYIPFENKNASPDVLSGKIIISTIDGAFINGYKVLDGLVVSQYRQKTESETASKTFRKDAEPDDDYWWDLGSLDEISITSTGAGGGGYIFIYSNPVSSQGWMNLNLSGNTSFGGGGSSNGGNGENSNSGEMPLFPCDNPTPNGCEEKEEDQIIITNLNNPCVENILKVLQQKDTKNSIVPDLTGVSHLSQTILDLFDTSTSYNLTFEIKQLGSTSAGEINAQTINVNDGWKITLDIDLVKNGTQLFIAKTLIHESMHAFINYSYKINKSSDLSKDLRELYEIYKVDNTPKTAENLTQHQFISQYVEALSHSLAAYDNHKHSDEYYNMLSWGGLETSTIYSSLANKTEIQKAINNERYGKSNAKGEKCD